MEIAFRSFFWSGPFLASLPGPPAPKKVPIHYPPENHPPHPPKFCKSYFCGYVLAFALSGETIGDTLALWINAIVWQLHKLLYKFSHPSTTKRDFVSYILSRKQHLHWTAFPIDLGERHYYDRILRIWMDAVGITWIYFTHPLEHPAHWLDGMGSGQIDFDIGAHRG
jgi:hypothetical protein